MKIGLNIHRYLVFSSLTLYFVLSSTTTTTQSTTTTQPSTIPPTTQETSTSSSYSMSTGTTETRTTSQVSIASTLSPTSGSSTTTTDQTMPTSTLPPPEAVTTTQTTTTQLSLTTTLSPNTISSSTTTTTPPSTTTTIQSVSTTQKSTPASTETSSTITSTESPTSTTGTISTTSTDVPTTTTGQLPDVFLIFASTGSLHRMDVNTGAYVDIPVGNSISPIALDYDPVGENVYFTDILNDQIQRVSIRGNADETVLNLEPGSHADGIAIDPISRLIFYTDTGYDIIAVVTIDDFQSTVLVDSGLSEPRAIALDFQRGHMYWTDLGQQKISTSLYDGTEVTDIITTGLVWPNAIALDLDGGLMYWADGMTNKIEASFFNGSNRQTLLDDGSIISQIFGLALYENYLFYTDWYYSSVFRISTEGQNKTTFTVGPSVPGRLNDIHVHHSSAATGTNICTNGKGGCSHICIPYKGNKKCLCPTGFSLSSDGISCDISTSTTVETSTFTSWSSTNSTFITSSTSETDSSSETTTTTSTPTTTAATTTTTSTPTTTAKITTTTYTPTTTAGTTTTTSTPTTTAATTTATSTPTTTAENATTISTSTTTAETTTTASTSTATAETPTTASTSITTAETTTTIIPVSISKTTFTTPSPSTTTTATNSTSTPKTTAETTTTTSTSTTTAETTTSTPSQKTTAETTTSTSTPPKTAETTTITSLPTTTAETTFTTPSPTTTAETTTSTTTLTTTTKTTTTSTPMTTSDTTTRTSTPSTTTEPTITNSTTTSVTTSTIPPSTTTADITTSTNASITTSETTTTTSTSTATSGTMFTTSFSTTTFVETMTTIPTQTTAYADTTITTASVTSTSETTTTPFTTTTTETVLTTSTQTTTSEKMAKTTSTATPETTSSPSRSTIAETTITTANQSTTSKTTASTSTPTTTLVEMTTTLTTATSETTNMTTSPTETSMKTTTSSPMTTSDVDECNTSNECDANAVCNNTYGSYTCTCLNGFTGNGLSCTVIAQLPMPYGQDEDQELFQVNEQDECILVENLECGFYVYDTHYERLYVCENGIVTFEKAYRSSSVPESNTVNEFSTFSESLPLAPYFSNVDARNGRGNIYYKVYSQELLENNTNVKTIVREFLDTANYNTTEIYMVIVVTWENVTEYGGNISKTSSFQLILVTDGSTFTFAFFAYLDGGMNFESGENFIGFAADSSVSTLNFRVSNPVQSFVNLGRSGFLLLQLNSGVDLPTTDCRHCEIWADQQQSSSVQSGYETNWGNMPECPCSRGNINVTNAFTLLDSEFFLTNDSRCYGLKSAQIYGAQLGSICCYINDSYVSQSPNAGFKTIWNPLVTLYKTNYRNTDKIVKQRCCSSGLCDVFYNYRPINDQCANSANASLGGGTGDPHIRTLDGTQYTFNGHGEYSLVDIDNGNFLIQGRTQPYLNAQNVSVGATIFSAFAGEDKVYGGHFMVSLNRNNSGMDVVVNNNDLTNDGDFLSFSAPDNTLTLDKRGRNILVIYFTNIGISVIIEYKIGFLAIAVTIPYELSGMPRGLMGNSNGNGDDDFIARNGSTFGPFSTDRQLYEMGQTWLVNIDDESVFLYPPGSTFRDFQDSEFDVRFLDEANPIKVNEARQYCGENNDPCIFDFVFTGLSSFAEETKVSVNEQDEIAIKIENKAPSISIEATDLKQDTGVVQVEVGVTKTITINGVDDGTIEFKVSKGEDLVILDETDTINSITMMLNFTSTDVTKEEISIVAIDNNGVEAPTLVIPILLCSGCNGRGSCDYNTPRTGQIGNSLLVVKCFCNPYFEGEDCELDFDGCFDTPCSLGRTCEDNNATFHQATNQSFTCSGCPIGYQLDEQENCIDVSECTNVTLNACEDICINTVGSFICGCSDGYRPKNKTHCDDEVGICNNSICPTLNGGCFLEDTEPTCFCFNGYQLNNDSCENINECNQAVCSQTCEDTVGSFSCGCFDGYTLNTDKTTCSVCREGFWGPECSNECTCSNLGTIRCDHIKGCVCSEKWTGSKCETDVNECTSIPNICNDMDKVCVNTPGSYRCECRNGYQLKTESGICEDYDECGDPDDNTCSQLCINTDGGFYCECESGYRLKADGNTCSDIDECTVGGTGCEQVCSNAIGSYRCVCFYGYVLNDDRRTCSKDTSDNLCVEEGLECEGYCIVGETSSSCGCSPGYTIGTDLQSCLDIDECGNSTLNQCGAKDSCVNIAGSYECSCPIGSQLENDGRTCRTCDDFHYGEECSKACNCGIGATTCDPVRGCICGLGWTGEKCDTDENECEITSSPCPGENALCINTPGNFTCSCLPGFSLSSNGACQDIDECLDVISNNCDQICANTVGSYQCSCYSGFVQNGILCQDINECLAVNECDQKCINTVGSYKCSCNSGFRLNTDNRKTCLPKDQCSESQAANCDAQSTRCIAESGNAVCLCRKGYSELNNSHCEDINECNVNNLCEQNCSNTDGSYFCSCEAGFKLDNDQISCLACNPGNYGTECRDNCSCVTINTDYCDTANGKCNCLTGWTGENCSQNMNECDENIAVCPGNSTCQDTNGAYVCRCDSGFFKDENGSCSGCSGTTYGINCAQKCECVTANTASCNPVNGICTCKDGWTCNNCSEDVDECDAGINNPCTEDYRSVCRNVVGGFQCDCTIGFELINDMCEDTNECLRGESNCTQKCTHTFGGFNCSCNPGYRGTGNNCTVCESGKWGDNCGQTCECDVNNTVNCNPTIGCVCEPGYTGINCTDDVDECTTVRNACPSNSNCTNIYGGVVCTCLSGYSQSNTSSGHTVCIKCSRNTYGTNCSEACDCMAEHTLEPSQACNHISGNCNCRWQWNGTRCEEDVDECTVGYDTCTKANETCLNSEGGFKCICEEGFFRDTSGDCNIATTPLTFANDSHESVSISIEIDIAVPTDVNLDDPETNTIYLTEIQQNLQTFMDGQVNNKQVVVNPVREGSIQIDFTIIYPKDSASAIGSTIANLSLGHPLRVFNQTGNVVRMFIGDQQVNVGTNVSRCVAYVAAIGPCQKGYYCDVLSNRPFCRKEAEEDPTPLIIALGIGVPLFILTAIIITLIICHYGRSMKNKNLSDGLRYEDSNKGIANSRVFRETLPTKIFKPSTLGPFGLSTGHSHDTKEYHLSEDASSISERHTWRIPRRIYSPIDPTQEFRIKRPQFSVTHLPRELPDEEH